jgi:hypothetical protein
MYNYIQYVNFPSIPDDILNSIELDVSKYLNPTKGKTIANSNYRTSSNFNQKVNSWCQENVCKSVYWIFQWSLGDLVIHKDAGPKTRINYLITPGGNNVLTEFFADDKTNKVASYCVEPHRWHILKADSYHHVVNVEPPAVRFSISGVVF